MDTIAILKAVGGGLFVIEYAYYLYSIYYGNTRPSRSSWWILSFVWIVVLASSVALSPGETFFAKWNALAGSWLLAVYILGSLLTAISSIKHGSKDLWGTFDYICLGLAVIGLVFYFSFDNKLISLGASIFADFFGILPTVRNAWRNPTDENARAWALSSIASLLALFTVTSWTLTPFGVADWSTPVYLFIMNTLIMLIVIIGTKAHAKN